MRSLALCCIRNIVFPLKSLLFKPPHGHLTHNKNVHTVYIYRLSNGRHLLEMERD